MRWLQDDEDSFFNKSFLLFAAVMLTVLFGCALGANYFKTRRYESCIAQHTPKECE